MGKAPRNRTIELSRKEMGDFSARVVKLDDGKSPIRKRDITICGDTFKVLDRIAPRSVDLVFTDPPYNLAKTFGGVSFSARDSSAYEEWTESWIEKIVPVLRPDGSIYVCSEWKSSSAVQRVLERHFHVHNRITWEREKGRGARRNWKNSSEDIWFCTMSQKYTFNVDKVKLRRKVIAPYTDIDGRPKDWQEVDGERFRETHPSNLWTDLTVPFWSMPENTPHPTQKPEKLLARIIIASSNAGDLVLDPFLGSGTTSVVCRKLKRHYIGIELDPDYCAIAEKRLQMADGDNSIQGCSGGIFWDRNSGKVART